MKCQCDTINSYKGRDKVWVSERRCGALVREGDEGDCLEPPVDAPITIAGDRVTFLAGDDHIEVNISHGALVLRLNHGKGRMRALCAVGEAANCLRVKSTEL